MNQTTSFRILGYTLLVFPLISFFAPFFVTTSQLDSMLINFLGVSAGLAGAFLLFIFWE